jgi:hypothetical protein
MKKILRFLGIWFMGITSTVTLLGGVGTTCVALNAGEYDSMKAIANFQWLYSLYVLAGISLGILGIRATIGLIKSRENAEKSALLPIVLGIIIGGIHMMTSRALRGSSMPVDGVVYITVLTLVILLIFRLPKVRDMGLYQIETKDDVSSAGGLTAIISGLLACSVHLWAGPTHIIAGINYADAFHNTMMYSGGALLLAGIGLVIKAVLFQPGHRALEQSS